MDIDRSRRTWAVREGRHYLFHIERPLDGDMELAAVIDEADARYSQLRDALGLAPLHAKGGERFVKPNYWIVREPWLPPADLRQGWEPVGNEVAGAAWARGEVTAAGITFGQMGFHWRELADELVHEEIHLLWKADVGEAPYLINEGVATWFERALSPEDRRHELPGDWAQVISAGGWRLRELCRNDGFSSAYRQGLPVYAVGAALVGYLIDVRGLRGLKQIFRSTTAEADDLAEILEDRCAQPLHAVEVDIEDWLGTTFGATTADVQPG